MCPCYFTAVMKMQSVEKLATGLLDVVIVVTVPVWICDPVETGSKLHIQTKFKHVTWKLFFYNLK